MRALRPAPDSGRLELADEGVQVDARSPRDVGGPGEEPERREAEREDRAELEGVAAGLAHGELLRRLLELVDGLVGVALDAADQLDGDPQEVPRVAS